MHAGRQASGWARGGQAANLGKNLLMGVCLVRDNTLDGGGGGDGRGGVMGLPRPRPTTSEREPGPGASRSQEGTSVSL
jgi:hypothetical protein